MPAYVLRDVSETLRKLRAMSMSLDDQIDLLRERANETGGTIKLPQPGNTWDDQQLVVDLHGVTATGNDWAEVIRNWTRAASTQSEEARA